MRIGIGLWCLQSTATAPRSHPRLYRELVDDARLAERVGLDSLWLSEHHVFYDGYCPALLPAASAVLSAWPGSLDVLARHLATRAATAQFPEIVARLADQLDPIT